MVLLGCKDTSLTGGVVVEESLRECKDSDGGINKGVQGVVNFGDEDYSDECIAGLLIEYYCDGNNKANQNVRCFNKCDSGKCI